MLAGIGAEFHAASRVPLGATGAALPDVHFAASSNADEIELVELGARFARAVETRPDYRFFALPGGPPFRPGLLRVAPDAGARIAAEVWTLSAQAFGAFVSRIPSPLGVGTLVLADGTTPKGFLVEAEAVRSAEDISAYGGWRAFMAAKAA